ncbi:C6 zinc finger domain-containing protein [Pochonia chlamydosporia 170]|uniref:C6 zinc finger domain-containing protein n=1 Tax=Pochonia chlamydosporia 170 TaxID=1380566 RepID=A0A179FC15_METCM|nr:C6 zinc finger domain-containing protein [Pochonia chlamydosporia 170]OAQ62968.1 C6 zinc finger domain-containing protein [Pochonia chlamydosporia 170]
MAPPPPAPPLQQQQHQLQLQNESSHRPDLALNDGGDSRDHHSSKLNGDATAVSPTAEAGVLLNRRPGKRPAARGTAFYPRKRANTACQVCRARKTKCDNKKPSCSYCLSVGATCIQSPVDLSSFDPASLKILDRLDDLERLLRTTGPATELSTSQSPPIPQVSPLAQPTSVFGNGNNSSYPSHLQVQQLDGTYVRRPSSHGAGNQAHTSNGRAEEDLPLDSVLPMRIDHILDWPVFHSTKSQGSPVYRAPPDAMSSPAGGAASLAALVDMESHRIYRLLDNFFLYIHCKNPILDESSARRMVGRAFLDGIDWSPASCLAMIICALGCIATPFGPSPETRIGSQAYADSQVFFQAAQKRIGILLVRSDIVGAQCLFLSGVYMMMVFQPIYAWRFFSQALAACQHFPFLAKAQDMSTESALSPGSVEMGRQDTQEQAVYWSAWKSERELRGQLSLPDFDIHHSGSTLYPPFFPAPPVPPAESPDGPDSEAQRSRASWLFYLAEISLRRLTSRLCSEVLNLRQRYSSNTTFLDVLADMTPEYEAQAQEWSDSLPGELSIRSAIDEDGIARSVLRGKLINLYEMIYWPFVMASLSALSSGRSLKPQYAELVKRGLDTHMHQIRANEPGFFHRHHGGFFMIRACTRSALTLVAAAKCGSAMPANWDEAVYKVIGMLAYWEEEDRDVAGWKSRLERELASIHE